MLARQTPDPFHPIPKSVDSAPRVKNAKLPEPVNNFSIKITSCQQSDLWMEDKPYDGHKTEKTTRSGP